MRPDEINKSVSVNREHSQELSPGAQEEAWRRAGISEGKEGGQSGGWELETRVWSPERKGGKYVKTE